MKQGEREGGKGDDSFISLESKGNRNLARSRNACSRAFAFEDSAERAARSNVACSNRPHVTHRVSAGCPFEGTRRTRRDAWPGLVNENR